MFAFLCRTRVDTLISKLLRAHQAPSMPRKKKNRGKFSGSSWAPGGNPGDSSGSPWSSDGVVRPPRPKHLRGREIGLYYRDLARQQFQHDPGMSREERLAEKHRRKMSKAAITLRIPPKVVERMNTNLESIEKVAKLLKIPLLPVKILKEIKSKNKAYFVDGERIEFTTETNITKSNETMTTVSEPNSESEESCNTSSDFGQSAVSKKPKIFDTKGELQNLKQINKKEDTNISWELNNPDDEYSICDTSSENMEPPDVFKKPDIITKRSSKNFQSSASLDFIPINTDPEPDQDYGSSGRLNSLRSSQAYKYGYQDIITGTFDEKLDECLAKGVDINKSTDEIKDLNIALYEDYKYMLNKDGYKKMMKFREILPTYKRKQQLIDVINKNQVVVISGETGCGKSTQVPQIILDDAITNGHGANCKIIVTQPRRIAASSLAKRVSQERGEHLGQSIGYAVRLEKEDPRPRGSVIFVTTGILLADLEVNQGLTNYSHVILDEVHERDCHIDLSMCLLKKVLKKRQDLKLILMSATIDAETLSAYFDNCPVMHIEGLAYPVKDIYLEEILEWTQYELPEQNNQLGHGHKWKQRKVTKSNMQKEIQFRAEVGPWLETIKHKISRGIFMTLLNYKIEELDLYLIVELLIRICHGPPGAILVFLPGIGEITKLVRMLDETGMFPQYQFQIHSLHSKLPSLEQHQIFERPPGNVRKIILATNIAETSITIDDIVYVVDCAKMKITGLQVDQNISTLKTEWVSQANLRQRRGRAGRCQPGICYHLVTTFRASKLAERVLPELQRSNLLEPVLTIKRLRLGNAEQALSTVPSPPNPSTVQWAVKHLQQCGALDETETLTPLGWHLARLPVHPSAGKLLLLGSLFGCLDRAASVAAVWGFKDPFQMVIGKEIEVDEARRRLALGEPSDHVAISQAIIEWERQGPQRKQFAYQNFLSNNTLELLSEMKHQLGDNLKQMGFLASGNVKSSWENRNSDNLSLFKAIVAAALYPNFATVKWNNLKSRKMRQITCGGRDPETGAKLLIHPSSVMSVGGGAFDQKRPIVKLCENPGANWLVYWLKQKTTDLFLFEVTLVYTLPLLFFAEVKVVEDEDRKANDSGTLLSISGVRVKCSNNSAELLFRFRSLLDQVLASKVGVGSDCATRQCDFEELVLNAVIELITAEDERAEYLGGDDSESDHSEYKGGSSRSWR